MKILICIPSKGRPYDLKTTEWLAKCSLPENCHVKVFVEPQEKRYYNLSLPKKDWLFTLPENDRGKGYAMFIATQYAKENGYDLQFFMDDDINGFIDFRAKSAFKVDVFNNLLRDIPTAFENDEKLGLVRFLSARAFYFVKNKQQQFVYKNQGAWGTMLVRTNQNKICPEITHYDDTAIQLYLWREGFHALTYGLAGVNVEVYTNKGGYQIRDRKKDAEDAIEFLKRDFPKVFMKSATHTLGYDIDIEAYKPKTENL
ncbi:MAG: hypothetical protein K0B15_07325 [Lentimicrobium sp.]|nr:hypothetical protein [Lentimicrobium sp.]